MDNPKETLHRYLRAHRDALLWKLDGVGEYDLRRPLTATGTNLLGLVKHVASVQAGYFGEVFDRPHDLDLPWLADDAEDNADMWVPADESTEGVLQLFRRSSDHADATIEALDLDAPGVVPWWPGERGHVTLHTILLHMAVELARHTGHADIVRELVDGQAGHRPGVSNMPDQDRAWWSAYVERVEDGARKVADHA